jgi:hypothetical protein
VPWSAVEDMDDAELLAWEVVIGEAEYGQDFDFDSMRWMKRT